MNTRIVFRGMEHSQLLEDYAREALSKTDKFLSHEVDPIQVDMVLEAHKQHQHHKVEIRLKSKHHHVVMSHEGTDIYVVIDYVVKHVVEEIKKNKDKMLDKRDSSKCC